MTAGPRDPAATQVGELLDHPAVHEILHEFAGIHQPGMTAEEFLGAMRPHVRAAGHAGRSVALKAGLASRTSREMTFAWPPSVTTVGVIAGLLGRGVHIESVDDTSHPQKVVVLGQIPSSPAHFGGTITCEVAADTAGSLVSFDVVFPGQAFAWGAGRRLIKAVASTTPDAAARISLTDAVRLDGLSK